MDAYIETEPESKIQEERERQGERMIPIDSQKYWQTEAETDRD